MKKGFTLLESMTVAVIMLILASTAFVSYVRAMDHAKQKACAMNQLVIEHAVENYFVLTGIAPATLSELKLEHLRKAYAQVKKDESWLTKFSYFLVNWHIPKQAYAAVENLGDLVQETEMQPLGITRVVLQCPNNPGKGISYGVNANLRNYASWDEIPQNLVLIADTHSSYTFNSSGDLDYRHRKKFGFGSTSFAVGTTKDAETGEINESTSSVNTLDSGTFSDGDNARKKKHKSHTKKKSAATEEETMPEPTSPGTTADVLISPYSNDDAWNPQ